MKRDAPDPAPGPRRVWFARYLGRAWRGEARFLPILYTFGVFGMLLLFVQQELLPRILDSIALELASVALLGAYFFWAGLLMWRCAANVSGWRWTFAAPFAGFAFIGSGAVFLGIAIWMCLGLLGLPVGLPLQMPGGLTRLVLRYWRGEERLWKAFWIFGAFIQALSWDVAVRLEPVGAAYDALVYGAWALTLGISLWANVAVWRCAFNTAWRPWGYAARAIAVAWFLVVLAGFALLVWLAISPHIADDSWYK